MTDETALEEKQPLLERIGYSNILRAGVFLAIIILYAIFPSRYVESFLIENMASSMRNGNNVEQINALSPMYDLYANSREYNLSTYANNPSSVISKTKFFTVDPRVIAMNKFLRDYHSPMSNSANTLVQEADKHGLDWRLVASISGVESAFGNITPAGSNNAWGWRGINGNEAGWSMFGSWNEAITHITQRLAQGYGTTLTPFEIEPTYCPPCGANPAHAWANGVTRFMNQLQYYVDNLERF